MDIITPRNHLTTRRQALRLLGGAIGAGAVAGASSGFLSPAQAASSTMTVGLTLDKLSYLAGDLMTMVVTENVVKPDSRKIVIADSAGQTWTKVSDDGVSPVYTALAGSTRAGTNTVTATVTRASDGASVSGSATYRLGAPWAPRFPGDRQGQVMLGMAVTDKPNSNLQWAQAMTLLGGASAFVSVRRCFNTGWITRAAIDSWADWADAQGIFPIISFKVPGNDWAGVAAGKYDSDLNLLMTRLDDRDALGKAPVCVAVHHEPSGDGSLAVWAQMQEYLSNKFAPLNDVFSFTTISNGFEWGPYLGSPSEVATMYPTRLIAALNRNGHILACDTYDSGSPTKLDYSQYDRTSLKMTGFTKWARAQGVQRIGFGEFGCHDDIDLMKCWAVIGANTDLFAYGSHFNSGQNSRADWRMIPQSYPPDPAVTSWNDKGGSAASANRLSAGRQIFSSCMKVGG